MKKSLRKRILVVDDEVQSCHILALYLEKKGFAVVEANNAAAAIKTLRRQAPDLIILDVIMPGMSGFELLRKLKKDQKHSQIPVIMLTALSQPESVEVGLSLAAEFYLPKPFELNHLMQFIKLIVKE